MYFLSWIIIGLMTGWLTGKLLQQGGYGPIVDSAIGAAGSAGGGFIMRLVNPSDDGGLTNLAPAFVGAEIPAGINRTLTFRHQKPFSAR